MNGMSNTRHLLTFLEAMRLLANHSTSLKPPTNRAPRIISANPLSPLSWKRVVDGGRGVRQVRPGGLSVPCSGNDTPGSGCANTFPGCTARVREQSESVLCCWIVLRVLYRKRKKVWLFFWRLKFLNVFCWNRYFRPGIYFCILANELIFCCCTVA